MASKNLKMKDVKKEKWKKLQKAYATLGYEYDMNVNEQVSSYLLNQLSKEKKAEGTEKSNKNILEEKVGPNIDKKISQKDDARSTQKVPQRFHSISSR